ncbi:MAG: hypothetical protein ACI9W6_003017 [Motiliproteus sp.]|jgi:hypothetical protein
MLITTQLEEPQLEQPQLEQLQAEQFQSERLRQQYLAAMGVTLWLPRQVLPGAAASPVWRWQAATPAASSAVQAAELTTVSARPVTHNAPLRQLVQGAKAAAGVQPAPAAVAAVSPAAAVPVGVSTPASVSKAKAKAKAVPEHQAPDAGAAVDALVLKSAAGPEVDVHAAVKTVTDSARALPSSAAVPRFRLAMLSYSDCLVVTEMPTSNAQVWTYEHQQLLNAVLAAVGLGGSPQASSGLYEFQWPLDPRARFDQSEAIARHSLEVALADVLQTSHRVLLLMGKSAQAYLLPSAQLGVSGQLIEHQGRSALCCHGLNEVLRLPGLKAELWRQLQPLRKLPLGR